MISWGSAGAPFSTSWLDGLTYQWKRLSEHYQFGSSTLFGDDFSSNDINQGYIGDCYYLAALSSVA
jgi:hypothetical protein